MFFLRCAFWLSIVYASMSWTHGEFASVDGGSLGDLARKEGASLMTKAAAGASDLCSRHAAECVTDAARLTALLASGEPSPSPAEGMRRQHVPMPVPDPRRRGGDAEPARAP